MSDLPPLDPENNAYFNPEFEQEEFSWKLNATWNMSDDTMMYATASSSFKSGGFNPISDASPLLTPEFGGNPDNAFFDPEFVDSYEIGLKTTLLGGAMQVNAAGFYYDYSDFQQSQIVNVTSKNVNSDAEMESSPTDMSGASVATVVPRISDSVPEMVSTMAGVLRALALCGRCANSRSAFGSSAVATKSSSNTSS